MYVDNFKTTNFIMTLDFDSTQCKNLVTGVLSIYVVYCLASVLQEWIMTQDYVNRFTGQVSRFKNANAFILYPSLVSWIVGYFLNRSAEKRTEIPRKNLLYCALLITCSTFAFTQAIYYTSFPIVMMVKSCNVLSVLMVGIFCSRVKDKNQKLGPKKIISGLIITVGILSFNLAGDHEQTEKATNIYGVGLLLLSLLCDGFLPDFQAEIKVNYKPSAMQMFEDTNRWKVYVSFVLGMVTWDIQYVGMFFYEHPLCFVHMIMLGSLGSIGQMVVFWMIKLFKQHIVPFTITTRKLVTVVISIAFFGHSTTLLQIVGIVVVFAAVVADFTHEILTHKNEGNQQLPKNQQEIPIKETSLSEEIEPTTETASPEDEEQKPKKLEVEDEDD